MLKVRKGSQKINFRQTILQLHSETSRLLRILKQRRPSSSEAMKNFPPVADLPLFSKKFRLCGKFSKFYLLPKNFFIFIRKNFSWPFFSHRPQISNFPHIFPVSVHFPLFRENYYFPLLWKIPPCFRKIHLLFTYFMCISFPPYFDHDALMHHPMHVLDAPVHKE